ncbi:MAG: chloride channel protein [Bryobacteraceae bacterium]
MSAATTPSPEPRRLKLYTLLPSMSEAQRFLLLSILIGVSAGLLVVCFHIAIDFTSWYTLGTPAGEHTFATLVSPAIGGLLATFLILRIFRAAQGSGVNQTKAALYISDGYVPFSTVIGKFLACTISIGTGNSLGPEDPALQMGSGTASLLGRLFRLTRDSMRRIAPVGAAAGIAAAFNTPITAVLFVMEEIIGAWNAGVLGSIVLAAVSAVVVSRWFLGDQPLFRVPEFDLTHPSELLVHAGIGIIAGLLAALFIKAIGLIRERMRRMPQGTNYVAPAIAGFAVGFIGLWLPQVMGAGYEAVDSALHNRFSWNVLLLLGIAKVAATLLCFSAGTPGGMFAPTLFSGAMLGGGIGALAQLYWPFPVSAPSAYVLVGMGTFFAGVFRAPLTSIFMIFEVSASYVIILPAMVSNILAYLISRSLQPVPFFTMIARHEGLDLPSVEEQREQRTLLVEDAMQPSPALVFPTEPLLAAALEQARKLDQPGVAVRSDGRWHWVSREELEQNADIAPSGLTLLQAVRAKPLPVLYRDLPLDEAMRRFGANPLLPVVSRANPENLIAILTLSDVHKAYGISVPVESHGVID